MTKEFRDLIEPHDQLEAMTSDLRGRTAALVAEYERCIDAERSLVDEQGRLLAAKDAEIEKLKRALRRAHGET